MNAAFVDYIATKKVVKNQLTAKMRLKMCFEKVVNACQS